jgi:PGF-CTERM protein
MIVGNPGSFYVSPTYSAYTGNWYFMSGGAAATPLTAAFQIAAPTISADVYDLTTGTTVTGGTVIQGDYLAIRVNSNLDQGINPVYRINGSVSNLPSGNVDLKVLSSSGNTYTALYTDNLGTGNYATITSQKVNSTSWYFGTSNGQVPTTSNSGLNWSTGALLPGSGQNAYPAGVYTVIAQSRLNGMYDNYLNGGATYTGATISQPGTVTIASNTVSLSANVDSVVRSKPFSVTITGKPYATYHLWVKGTSTMDGTYNNQPPYITPNQAGVAFDTTTGTNKVVDLSIPNDGGNYTPQNNNMNLWNLVAHGTASAGTLTTLANGTYIYANVTLDQTGTRTVQFTTTNWTKAQQYTVRVEQLFAGTTGYKYDEVNVQVQQGAVTIVAAGSQSYYLGEEVQFSGTNTESSTTYLFITGPNLATQGADIWSTNPRYGGSGSNYGVLNGNASDFQAISVNGDNTWSWQWGTQAVALDAGTYTVYAVSGPFDANDLQNVAYGTVSIVIKAPFVSATASQSTVAQGDPVYITGTAQGQPTLGVKIWILGKNYALVASQAVNSDSSFSYKLQGTTTQNMAAGQYFIVVQHPMENGVFDVYTADATGNPVSTIGSGNVYVYTTGPGGSTTNSPGLDFQLTGSGSLQGANAAEALVEAINSANVDDTYTKLQLLVETPVITINTIGDHYVGDKFTITATTNLAVGDNVLFTVYSSSFQPTDKTQSGEFSGASGTVQVTQGTNGLNALSFNVDASTFKPDEYLVTATNQGVATSVQATGTALFNVLQASAQTATPTVVATVTTAAAPTTVATQMATTVAPTKTPTQPGFGALVAVIGLGAVALLVVRRH